MMQPPYLDVQPSPKASDLTAIGEHMFDLMLRNVTSTKIVYADPAHGDVLSKAGCVLASPSLPADLGSGWQNYVHNWTRDAAITMMEIIAPGSPISDAEVAKRMSDYIEFANLCQQSAPAHMFDIACFRIDGKPRCEPAPPTHCWSRQSDGPALQTLAILQYFANLSGPTKDTARAVVTKNLEFLLNDSTDNDPPGPAYKAKTTSPWEEESGYSFFARAVQLRCLQAVKATPVDITPPAGLDQAIVWLEQRFDEHWNGEFYRTFSPDLTVTPPVDWAPPDPDRLPYDPNSDIVMACLYGAVEVTDPRLLATAATIRDEYADPRSANYYPVNGADNGRQMGPLLGRYPGDFYDGDVADSPDNKDHPWALCTCNLAELYYRLAKEITQHADLLSNDLTKRFFEQIELPPGATPDEAATALLDAGDSMLRAIIFHSDNLELSEQFDRESGFQKSVSNLTWSYATYLSAIRSRQLVGS